MIPITKAYGVDGELLHDCEAAGCDVSWDGHDRVTGAMVEGREPPGDEWDVSTPGVARLKPPAE